MITESMAKIDRVAVIGAGNMGSGIAQKIATEGYPVVLVDISAEQVAAGVERVQQTLAEGVERRIFKQSAVDQILGRIQATTDWQQVADVDLAIEAVFEDAGVKQQVFEQLDRHCKPEAILATNTSSLYVRELARATTRAERFIGLHYFYHPAKNRLVEVIAGEGTPAAVYELAWRFQEMIGKTPIRSADAPGFVVNRYFVPWLNEAVRLLEEGVADIPTIEAAAKTGFRIGMGPFQLMNVTGVPIALHAATTLGRELGPFYAPSARLASQVESGERWALEGEPDPARSAAVVDRLLGTTFLIAGQLIDEGVATIEDVDIGARVGLRWSEGPFQLLNRGGIERGLALAQATAERWELALPRTLAEQAATGQPFAFEWVRLDVEAGVATLTLNRPDAMNALNFEVLQQLDARFDEALARSDVTGIVLQGAGKAFVAGADIRFFVKNIKAARFDRIRQLTEFGQALYQKIDDSPKTVVVKLDGLSLGGGSELALTADYLVATPRGSLGFPETGIGIYPGLGGTQRTQRRVGQALTRYLVATGDAVDAQRAVQIGLVDVVVEPHEVDARARALALERPPVVERQPGNTAGFERQARFFGEHSVKAILAGEVTPADEEEAKWLRRVQQKAPKALEVAEALILEGGKLPLAKGLELELSQLETIFETEDALTGLSSLGGERPEFQGR